MPSLPSPAPLEAARPSLPPVAQDADLIPSTSLMPRPKRSDPYKLPKTSMVRRKALAILAMRANGYSEDDIAAELHISKNSIHVYLYRAARAGKLQNKKGESLLVDPHDRIQYDLANKAADNLKEMLESTTILERGQKSVKMEATKMVAEGVLFKRFDAPKETSMPSTMLQINIQGDTSKVDVNEGGTPLYTDGTILPRGEE
jgi:DNA-binding CsgD family transcriptional regulator